MQGVWRLNPAERIRLDCAPEWSVFRVGGRPVTAVGRELRSKSQPRRGLRRVEAAIYVGIEPTKFDEMVHDGRMPRPKRIDGATVWDQRRLDRHRGIARRG